ncbi:MAG: hypothetical protein IJR49_01600 [Treponema sp.]|nr:hypothetical protein [Treponema sp.]
MDKLYQNRTHALFVFISLIVYITLICLIRIRKKRLLKRAGEKVFLLQEKNANYTVLTLVFVPVLILISPIVKSFFAFLILLLCAIIASEISCQDLISLKISGIYEKGIIFSGKFISLSRIQNVRLQEKLISLDLEKNRTMQILCADKNECEILYTHIKERLCNREDSAK